MKAVKLSTELNDIITSAMIIAESCRNKLLTPEHLLLAALNEEKMTDFIESLDLDGYLTLTEVKNQLRDYIDKLDSDARDEPTHELFASHQYGELMQLLEKHCEANSIEVVGLSEVFYYILQLKESNAATELDALLGDDRERFFLRLNDTYLPMLSEQKAENQNIQEGEDMPDIDVRDEKKQATQGWRDYVLCINDHLKDHNPLIGREAELDRTVQVLCRKDKNNPLHIGEPGVGKTSIVYGLAQRIEDGNVPESLQGAKIYQLDLGALIAGTQYRGDFEKRLKSVMKGIAAEKGAILYIDEIHNIVGAGQTGEGSMDASNLLKPYLEGGRVRFIGSTTYEEYNRYIMRNKGLMRRFQQVPIEEPSIDETMKIVEMLKESYETFHQVKYDDDALELAVTGSARHITDRYLPDKAIDLMDESGAWVQMHHKADEVRRVDKALMANVLARIAKVDALTMDEEDNSRLESLESRVKSFIYGQDVAVKQVVEAVQMSKAGLTDGNKPLASLLFVGPTGVGKTEVARVLARELGVELVRFDMSEYVEKHTVAKLIGSPAGYVGYDDGGLLTDAVRKHPDCVLLLDEIEKAHDDVFNLLLQVMDYGTLSDNKGRKAVFRNVVLIMTSNAGAQFAHQASVGFASSVTAGQAMLKQVKKTFKPEFINRLSSIVVFNDMDRTMAGMILDKKLRELQAMLTPKGVTLTLGEKAREQLLSEGYSKEYGAREMDRVIHNRLKSRLVREILFGELKQGGEYVINELEQEE